MGFSALWVKGEIFRNLDDAESAAKGLDRAGQASLFDRFDWFARVWEHCPPAEFPLIARSRAEGSDAWLFLAEDERGHARALATWYTLAFRPVFTGDPPDNARAAMLTAMARRLRKRLSSIHLSTLPQADCDLLARFFRRAGWAAFASETSCNWTINVRGQSFAEFLAGRAGELRSTIKRKGAKAGMETSIFNHFDENAWVAYEAIYAASWKPDEGSSAFLREMAEAEGAAGTLRLGIGRIEGETVAAQLWTVENGVAVIHKLAHLDSAGKHSPGTLLTAAMFEHAIDTDRVDLIDFGTGDDRYKADWMDTRAPLCTLALFNTRRAGGMLGAAKAWASALVGRIRTR